MKSVVVIQEVKILSWVTASHRPGSETHWQEETNVRSWVNQVGRYCMEPRNEQNCGPARDKRQMNPEFVCRELRTALGRWNAISEPTTMASRFGSHRGRRPGHADQGMTRELVRASLFPVFEKRGSATEPHSVGVHRDTKAPLGKASTARSIREQNAENPGTTQRAG